jgi:hypothetical protein
LTRLLLQRLQLKYDELLSEFAYNLNLRRYSKVARLQRLALAG